jgi:hypothetical protein
MKSSVKLLFVAFILAGIGTTYFACTKDRAKAIPPAPVAVCDTMKVTYTKHIAPLLAAKCGSVGGCHSAAIQDGGVNLSDYANTLLSAKNNTLRTSTIDQSSKPMPKGGSKLPNSEIQLLDCWLKNGYVEK